MTTCLFGCPCEKHFQNAQVVTPVVDAENWARDLVEAASWAHLSHSPVCLGYVIQNDGRVVCTRCEWRISARLNEAGTARSARFALFALATIGANFTWKLVDAMRGAS